MNLKNRDSFKGRDSISNLVRFSIGKHPPKLNRSFLPRGMEPLKHHQLAYMLIALLKHFEPFQYKKLVESMQNLKPASIPFSKSPVRVNVTTKEAHREIKHPPKKTRQRAPKLNQKQNSNNRSNGRVYNYRQ
tara:strand:- start:128 stop:523 length:396 start_codon:yes stop_codon:yes gene_type:complete